MIVDSHIPSVLARSADMLAKTTTIAAPATPPGRGGIGVIRISGSKTRRIAREILGHLPPPRRAVHKNFRDASGSPIDAGLALFFPAPHSFTGEDVLELHGHGGPVVMDLLLRRVIRLGAEPAKPGEFSQRAFLNGKIDLLQAEAIADLIDSVSEQAARGAQRSLEGQFSRVIHALLERLAALRAYIEAAIDFPDEDIDFLSEGDTGNRLAAITRDLDAIFDAARQGSLLREGIRVAIAGRPNVGKSSLLNVLAGRDTAIVTDIPGTTRDVLREHIRIDGHPFHLFDTAGIRQAPDRIERHGIRRAFDAMQDADILLLVIDENALQPQDHEILARFRSRPDPADRPPQPPFQQEIPKPRPRGAGLGVGEGNTREGSGPGARDDDRQPGSLESHIENGDEQAFASSSPITLIIQNKIDLTHLSPEILATDLGPQVRLSAKTGAGISLLRQQLKVQIQTRQTTEGVFLARRRHLNALERARSALDSARQQLTADAPELLAEDLRRIQQALGEITGQYTTEDLLDRIFSDFCIGK